MYFGGDFHYDLCMAGRDDGARREDEELRGRIGAQVRLLREGRGWSREYLAGEAGLHNNHVGFVERGEKMPSVWALRRIARALGMTASELLARVGE